MVVSVSVSFSSRCVTLTEARIEELVGDDGCILGIGGWTTSKNTGSENIRGSGTVLVGAGVARIGAEFFASV